MWIVLNIAEFELNMTPLAAHIFWAPFRRALVILFYFQLKALHIDVGWEHRAEMEMRPITQTENIPILLYYNNLLLPLPLYSTEVSFVHYAKVQNNKCALKLLYFVTCKLLAAWVAPQLNFDRLCTRRRLAKAKRHVLLGTSPLVRHHISSSKYVLTWSRNCWQLRYYEWRLLPWDT